MNINTFFFLLGILLPNCFYAKKITPLEYINVYKGDAITEMKRSGVPASITLAQGMLESGYGNSELARKANNHFGIKCHSSWSGSIYRLDDDKKDECFRKYKTVWQSYRDHSNFLKNSRRYAFLFDLKISDYKGWCRGLKKAGYATNKKYDNLLIEMIERYELNRFVHKNKLRKSKHNNEIRAKLSEKKDDNTEIKLGKNKRIKKSSNWINYIEVKKGDTYYNISQNFSISLPSLYRYNDCDSDTLLKIGTHIYLQPKRLRGTQRIHVFRENDVTYRISQQYGIKLKKLYKRNNWSKDYKPLVGEKVYLRGSRK